MPHKSPHDLDVGAQLVKDVYNLDGKVLFHSGSVLGDRQIEILMMWGVQSVEVDGEPDESDGIELAQFSQRVVAKAEAAVNRRYKLVKSSHPVVEIIRRICVLEAAKAAQVERPNS